MSREQEYRERMEELRSEAKAIIHVLEARLSGAQDWDDWSTIRDQVIQLKNATDKARNFSMLKEKP